jgi:hypothetical protein
MTSGGSAADKSTSDGSSGDLLRHRAADRAAEAKVWMSSIEDTWPLPVYDPGPPKHVHAIGVIALTYTTLQACMDCLFLNRAGSQWAEKYYYVLTEERRSEAIKELFKDDDPSVIEAIGNIIFRLVQSLPEHPSARRKLSARCCSLSWWRSCPDQAIEERVHGARLHGADLAGATRRCGSYASRDCSVRED